MKIIKCSLFKLCFQTEGLPHRLIFHRKKCRKGLLLSKDLSQKSSHGSLLFLGGTVSTHLKNMIVKLDQIGSFPQGSG